MPSVNSHWKIPVPFAATRCGQAFRQVEWNHYADQAGTDALQQSAKNQRLVPMRERNYGNAGNKQKSAERHQKLAAHEVRQQSGK